MKIAVQAVKSVTGHVKLPGNGLLASKALNKKPNAHVRIRTLNGMARMSVQQGGQHV
jgi:hypothetical protein